MQDCTFQAVEVVLPLKAVNVAELDIRSESILENGWSAQALVDFHCNTCTS